MENLIFFFSGSAYEFSNPKGEGNKEYRKLFRDGLKGKLFYGKIVKNKKECVNFAHASEK